LDEWLHRHALQAEASGSAKVFVTTSDGATVVGYYAVAMAQVEHASAPARVLKGQAKRPVPAVLLARLAVDRQHQRKGLGYSVLQDAMLRCLQASEAVGVRVLLVHAKHEEARAWYEQYGFERSPTDPLHLMLLMKDLKAFVEGRS
jgi:GNAT superfamily N-acetyltransferase